MEEATYEDFAKLEIRVGLVRSAEEVAGSEKLLKLTVDFGSEERQIVAGVRKFYSAEDLVGNKFVFITNLRTRKIMGLESQGMMLAAEDSEGNLSTLAPQREIEKGSRVR